MPEFNKDNTRFEKVLCRIQRYCAYQEHCQSEVKKKLTEWELDSNDINKIIKLLIDEKYIDNVRYATVFVEGKFHQKKWGKIKIANELRKKNIPESIIAKSLQSISDKEYIEEFKKVAKKKINLLHEKDKFVRKNKLIRYLLTKGYELSFIMENFVE